MQKTIFAISAAILAVALGLALYSKRTAIEEPIPVQVEAVPAVIQEGPIHVAFELGGIDGNMHNFSEWDGKHRIVNFWATWCAPCRREIPLLKAFQEEHGVDDFQVIGIAVEFLEPVVAYAEDAQFNYPILYGELDAMEFLKLVRSKAAALGIADDMLKRAVNVGFSGGEKKRSEILQMAVLEPRLAILDETDSGLDIDALKIVAHGVNNMRRPDNAIVVVTHYQRLLNYIVPDYVHVLVDGRIVKSGGKELALELEAQGYEWVQEAGAAS